MTVTAGETRRTRFVPGLNAGGFRPEVLVNSSPGRPRPG
jgi:hypothetical protein